MPPGEARRHFATLKVYPLGLQVAPSERPLSVLIVAPWAKAKL